MSDEPNDEFLEEQNEAAPEVEETERLPDRFALLVFQWLETERDDCEAVENILAEAHQCSPDEIKDGIANLSQEAAYRAHRFANAELRPLFMALEELVAQLPETLAPRKLLSPLRHTVAFQRGDVDMLLELLRPYATDLGSGNALANQSDGDKTSTGETDIEDSTVVKYLEALQALRPTLIAALGEVRAGALELMLAPTLHVSRKLLCVNDNPWLLDRSTAELVERLLAETPAVLHHGLNSLRDTLEKESGRHPEVVAARKRSRDVLDALRVIARRKVSEHPGHELSALFDGLDSVDVSPFVAGIHYLMEELSFPVVKTSEEAALYWLVWRVYKTAEVSEALLVDIAQAVARRITHWSTQPAVARRLLDLFLLTFKGAHLLHYHPPILIAQLHLDTARILHELYRHTHDEGHLKFCYIHARRAMEWGNRLHEFDLVAHALDVYILVIKQRSGPEFGRARAIETLRNFIETGSVFAPIIAAKARFRLAHMLMEEETDEGGVHLEEARHLLEQAIQALETETEVPETLSNLYLLLASCHRRAYISGDTAALQLELETHERALSLQTDDFVSDQFGAIVTHYVQALELSGASPDQCLSHIERALARLKAGSDDATRGLLLQSRADFRSRLGELTLPVSDWYEPALRDLHEAREAFAILQLPDHLGHILLTELRVHGRARRLDEAIATYRQHMSELTLDQNPRLKLELLCDVVELYLCRNQGRDFRSAKQLMAQVLTLASQPDCLQRVAEQARRFVHYSADAETPLDIRPLDEQIAHLLDLLPREWHEALQLAMDAWRCRRTGDPAPESIVYRFLERTKGAPIADNFPHIQDAFYFALKTLKPSHRVIQEVSRNLEEALLKITPEAATDAHISCLSDVALMRLQVDPLTLRHAKASERLLDHADKLRAGLPNLADRSARALVANRFRVRLHILGLTPGQSDEALLIEAGKLMEDCATQPAAERRYLAGQLCCYLANLRLSDSVTVLAKLEEIQNSLLREGLVLELPPELLPELRKRTDVRPQSLEPSSQAQGLMAEAQKLIHFNNQRPLETYPKVQAMLETALRLLAPEDVKGQLTHAETSAELELLWHELDEVAGHQRRGLEITRKALAHPQITAYPIEKAKLLRGLARLITHESSFNPRPDPEPYRQAVELLKEAWRCDLSGAPLVQFMILLNLANARRWLYQRQENPDRDLILAAAREYRQALALAATTKDVGQFDVATGKKCLAEALRLIGDPASLYEAIGLARESLEERLHHRSLVPAAESALLVAQLEMDRAEAGHAGALESAREAVLEGLGFVRPEAAPNVYAALSMLRAEIERQLGASGKNDAEGPNRLDFAARRKRQAIRRAASRGDKDPHALDEDEAVAAGELLMRGSLGDSALSKAAATMLSSIFLTLAKYGQNPARVDLNAEVAEIELLVKKEEILNAGRQMLGLLALALGPYRLEPDRSRFIGVLKRLLHPSRTSSLSWDMACLLLQQAAHFGVATRNHTGEEEGELAIAWSRRALELCEQHAPNDFGLGEILTCLGLALYHSPSGKRWERCTEAQRVLERVLAHSRQFNDENQEAIALLNLGAVVSALARLDESLRPTLLPIYEQAIAIRRRRDDKRTLAQLLSALGYTLVEGRLPCSNETASRAVALLQEARKILETLGVRDSEYTHVIGHLGIAYERVYFNERDLEALRLSRECHAEAARLNRALGNPIEEARALHNLGASLIRDPSPEQRRKAVTMLLQALSVRLDRISEAWETLTTLWESMENRLIPELPAQLVSLVVTCQKKLRHQLEQAGEDLRALEVERSLLSFFARCAELDPRSLTGVLQDQGDEAVVRAERLWNRAASADSQLEIARLLGDICSIRAWLAAKGGAPALDGLVHAARGRARTLVSHRAARQRVLSPAALNQRIELDQSLRKGEDTADVSSLSHRIAQQEALRKLLSEETYSHEVAGNGIPFQVLHSDLEARLRAESGTALIHITTSELGTVVTVASLDAMQQLQLETRCLSVSTRDIVCWLRKTSDASKPGWIEALEGLNTFSPAHMEAWVEGAERCAVLIERPLVALYRELIGPAVDGLSERGVQHLVFSVAGPLSLLPISAAQNSDATGRTRYLLEDFQSIRLIPSITTFLQGQAESASSDRHVLLLATNVMAESSDGLSDGQLYTHLNTLTSTWQEAGYRVELQGTVLSGAPRATLAACQDALERVDLVHLLCHGVFDSQSRKNTGLLLEDGLLSSQMLFQRPFPLRAKRVIVSACQSARTHENDLGGEMPGIAGMLLRSGVDTVVGALWDVSYLTSARLMERFHAALVAGKTAPIALGLAMREALAEGRLLGNNSEARETTSHPMVAPLLGKHRRRMARLLASPLFWAGFEVIGVG